jgi:hypothetical protein
MDASQSSPVGAMFAGGFEGGRIPAAPAGALDGPAANALAVMIPIGSNNAATRQRPRPDTALPLRISFPESGYREGAFPYEWVLLTKTCESDLRSAHQNENFDQDL